MSTLAAYGPKLGDFDYADGGVGGTVDSDQECDVLCDENCEDEECPSCDESQVCCNPEFCSSGDCDDQVAWTTLNRSVSHIILL